MRKLSEAPTTRLSEARNHRKATGINSVGFSKKLIENNSRERDNKPDKLEFWRKRCRNVRRPCCGIYDFIERQKDNDYLCAVCFWKDDLNEECGSNQVGLNQTRKNYVEFGACKKEMRKYVHCPLDNEKRGMESNPRFSGVTDFRVIPVFIYFNKWFAEWVYHNTKREWALRKICMIKELKWM